MSFVKGKRTIFVDFDDTIFVWRHSYSGYSKNIEYCFLHKKFYEEAGGPNWILIKQLEAVKKDCNIILLTHTCTSMELKMKEEYLNKHCPNLFDEYIGTDSGNDKILVLDAFVKVCKLKPSEIMLIDDRNATYDAAEEAGYSARYPLDVILHGIEW